MPGRAGPDPGAAALRGAQHLLDQRRLVAVMLGFTAAPMPVSLLYPHRRQLPARVAACLNWITEVVVPHLQAAPPRTR